MLAFGKARSFLRTDQLDQSALTWELKTETTFAQARIRHAQRENARGLLSEVYKRFTDGYATRDLKAARTLLGDLEREPAP